MAMRLASWIWVSLAIGLGFAHGGGDRGLLHLVLMVDFGLLVVVVSSVCSAAVVGLW